MPAVSPAVALILHFCQLSPYEVSQLGVLTDTPADFRVELPLVAISPRLGISPFKPTALSAMVSQVANLLSPLHPPVALQVVYP